MTYQLKESTGEGLKQSIENGICFHGAKSLGLLEPLQNYVIGRVCNRQTDTLNYDCDRKEPLKENRPTQKANIVPPPTQLLERVLGDRPDPYKARAACARDFRDVGFLKGDRV
jgi:hypothetical protein